MATERTRTNKIIRQGPPGFLFLITYIGAATYFISRTDGGFWEVILALLQALVWPAYLVYYVLSFLGA